MARDHPRKNAVDAAVATPAAPCGRANNGPQLPFAYKVVIIHWLLTEGV